MLIAQVLEQVEPEKCVQLNGCSRYDLGPVRVWARSARSLPQVWQRAHILILELITPRMSRVRTTDQVLKMIQEVRGR